MNRTHNVAQCTAYFVSEERRDGEDGEMSTTELVVDVRNLLIVDLYAMLSMSELVTCVVRIKLL